MGQSSTGSAFNLVPSARKDSQKRVYGRVYMRVLNVDDRNVRLLAFT